MQYRGGYLEYRGDILSRVGGVQHHGGNQEYRGGFSTVGPGGFECNLTGRCPFFKNLHNPFRNENCISIPCFGIIRLSKNSKNNRENNSLLFLKRISDQFSYPVQEFMLKNDTLKNGTSRIGLYGSAPRDRGGTQITKDFPSRY